MINKTLVVINEMGIHARPAAAIVRVAGQYASDITFSKDGVRANAKSILNILMLAAEPGCEIEVEIEGPDQDEALAAMEKLFLDKFHDEA